MRDELNKISDNITVTGTNFTASTEASVKQAEIIFAKENVAITVSQKNIHVQTYKILGYKEIGYSGEPTSGQFTGTIPIPSS